MDGSAVEMWSRGTRIFQHIDGRWQRIHQHVSFPIDANGRESEQRRCLRHAEAPHAARDQRAKITLRRVVALPEPSGDLAKAF